jgi:hypothetical protein
VNAHQVRVPDLPEGLKLVQEIFGEGVARQLDGDVGGERVVKGAEDRSAPTRTEAAQYAVSTWELGEDGV